MQLDMCPGELLDRLIIRRFRLQLCAVSSRERREKLLNEVADIERAIKGFDFPNDLECALQSVNAKLWNMECDFSKNELNFSQEVIEEYISLKVKRVQIRSKIDSHFGCGTREYRNFVNKIPCGD
ncbi:hypothetical protein TRP8649_00114 [Pelagimonas phthalicica]|uniref:Uncharacterized protein n=1 Tax=Pelagimonas phthalicica TaxID=1037362 RepID=A0A238J7X1_9RHOB|nr:hypothetical protein CLV87_1959 [Pelagimonas phthalicica]SMX26042.1 hypothetical protein TRP8649_00114 [Pelagimonas phthalicica]